MPTRSETGAPKAAAGNVFIFVDNSNIFIGGQEIYGALHGPELGQRYRVDFGTLFDHVAAGRGSPFFSAAGKQYPRLYGSEPPQLDSLWTRLKGMGVNVNVFQRNAFNKEKEVDTALVWDAAELVLKRSPEKGRDVIAVLAGDKDFLKIYQEGMAVGYSVEYYSWERRTVKDIRMLRSFHDLTPLIDKIGFVEKDRFDHEFGPVDWSKVVPYRE